MDVLSKQNLTSKVGLTTILPLLVGFFFKVNMDNLKKYLNNLFISKTIILLSQGFCLTTLVIMTKEIKLTTSSLISFSLVIFSLLIGSLVDIITLKTKTIQYDKINTFSLEMQHQLFMLRKSYNAIDDLVKKEPEAGYDSITFQTTRLRDYAIMHSMPGCMTECEVDSEYEAVILLKRKSLPFDEVLELFHAEKFI